jgi:hypothetical protein
MPNGALYGTIGQFDAGVDSQQISATAGRRALDYRSNYKATTFPTGSVLAMALLDSSAHRATKPKAMRTASSRADTRRVLNLVSDPMASFRVED